MTDEETILLNKIRNKAYLHMGLSTLVYFSGTFMLNYIFPENELYGKIWASLLLLRLLLFVAIDIMLMHDIKKRKASYKLPQA